MSPIHPLAAAHALARWTRHDAHRFLRPDWRRHVQKGSDLEALYEQIERKYRPDQPRVPAGVREGGRWMADGSGSGAGTPSDGSTSGNTSGRNDPRVLSDANPENQAIPGAQYAQYTFGVLVTEIPLTNGRNCVYNLENRLVIVPGPVNFRCSQKVPSSALSHGKFLNDN